MAQETGRAVVRKRSKGEKPATDIALEVHDRWVVMSNALARAGDGLTLSEKRLVMLAISKLDAKRKPVHGEIVTSTVTAAEYGELCGLDRDNAYKQLKAAKARLYGRSINVLPRYRDQFIEGRRGIHGGDESDNLRWIYRAIYGNGAVTLYWSPSLYPHILDIKTHFMEHQAHQAAHFRSGYSWPLLRVLSSWRDRGECEIELAELCTALDVPEKQRANFAHMRRRVIEPAVLDLNEKDGWAIEWTPMKTGKKVTTLYFKFERDPQGRLSFDAKADA